MSTNGHALTSHTSAATWWVVFKRELADLWIGGRALTLLLIYSTLLGVITYVLASNSELSLIPPKEMVYETLKTAIAAGLFMGLIIGADTLSGERERGTLEALLLTPTSRTQIVLGKFLAAITPWPAAFVFTIPLLVVLAQGGDVLGPAIVWGFLLGSILAPAYTGLGMLVSYFTATNKNSYFVSLGLYIFCLVPAQLPGTAQTGVMGQFLQWVNPMAATSHYLSKTLVNNRTFDEFWTWLTSPIALACVVLGILFIYAGPRLRLEPGSVPRWPLMWARKLGLPVVAGLLLVLGAVPAVGAQEASSQALEISIDADYKALKAGDHIRFQTVVKNNDAVNSPPLILAMNIINLDGEGDPVDPEDWSPQRTQYVEMLAAGSAEEHSWRVDAILEGDYMVYMVLVPQPGAADATSLPIASSGIHLTVAPFTQLNPSGVLPYAAGGPIVLGLGTLLVYRYRRHSIDSGVADE